MTRFGLPWLVGVVCGVAICYVAFRLGVIGIPGSAERAPAPPASQIASPGPECDCPGDTQSERLEARNAPAAERDLQQLVPSPEAEAVPVERVSGIDDLPMRLFTLVDERYLDPAPGAVPLESGGGPPATLVCDYRPEDGDTIITNTSRFDSLMIPRPSCPFEIELPPE